MEQAIRAYFSPALEESAEISRRSTKHRCRRRLRFDRHYTTEPNQTVLAWQLEVGQLSTVPFGRHSHNKVNPSPTIPYPAGSYKCLCEWGISAWCLGHLALYPQFVYSTHSNMIPSSRVIASAQSTEAMLVAKLHTKHHQSNEPVTGSKSVFFSLLSELVYPGCTAKTQSEGVSQKNKKQLCLPFAVGRR